MDVKELTCTIMNSPFEGVKIKVLDENVSLLQFKISDTSIMITPATTNRPESVNHFKMTECHSN